MDNELSNFKSLKQLATIMDMQMLVDAGIKVDFSKQFMRLLNETVTILDTKK